MAGRKGARERLGAIGDDIEDEVVAAAREVLRYATPGSTLGTSVTVRVRGMLWPIQQHEEHENVFYIATCLYPFQRGNT